MSAFVFARITYENSAQKRVLKLVERIEEVLKTQAGFLGLQKFIGLETNEVIGLIEWESIECHEACQQTPAWLMLLPDWSALEEDEAAKLESKVYERLD